MTETSTPDPPYAETVHASSDGTGVPGEVYTTYCDQRFTHAPRDREPAHACIDCLEALIEACEDYADRLTDVAHGLIAASGALRVVDDALARPGAARKHGLDDETEETHE